MSEPDKKPDKDWTAMFYLAGENNLADDCVFALKELKRARPRHKRNNNDEEISQADRDKVVDAEVKVVAQLDAGGLGGDEVRYVLKRGDEDGELDDDELTRIDTTQTTYRGVLKDFISSSILNDGHAKHYFLVLSGHGNGLISDFLSRDIDTPDKLSIPKIRWVLREVKKDFTEQFGEKDGEKFKIDVLGLDSCMMSMAEIGYELRHYVNYMVGAEGFEPNSGWPYERILSAIQIKSRIKPDDRDTSGIKPADLAVQIVDSYVKYYTDFLPAARSVDLSACDLSKCDKLASAIRVLADTMYDKISQLESGEAEERAAAKETLRHIVLAHWEAQSYKDDQYVDLYDFCNLLDRGQRESDSEANTVTGSVLMRGLTVDSKIRAACRGVKKVLIGSGKNGEDAEDTKSMVIRSRYSGPAVQYSNGLSVYFPWSHVIDSYEDLEFATDTNWKRFLDKYVELTRRRVRPCPIGLEKKPVVEGRLFLNEVTAGFDFINSENKNAPTFNKVLSNKVGGMKNPPIDHVACQCFKKKSRKKDKDNPPTAPEKTKRTAKKISD